MVPDSLGGSIYAAGGSPEVVMYIVIVIVIVIGLISSYDSYVKF